QRLRPYAPGLMWYEGLRVATAHRRKGIARAMLEEAIDEARGHGFREMRLATRDEPAVRLFESAGFKLRGGRRGGRGSPGRGWGAGPHTRPVRGARALVDACGEQGL